MDEALSRRTFLFAIPAVAVLASRVPDPDRRLLNRCLVRACGIAFQDFGRGTVVTLHGNEAVVTNRQGATLAQMFEQSVQAADARTAAKSITYRKGEA